MLWLIAAVGGVWGQIFGEAVGGVWGQIWRSAPRLRLQNGGLLFPTALMRDVAQLATIPTNAWTMLLTSYYLHRAKRPFKYDY